ncbi:MAG: PUR family DNA/RNA-binding protein [Bacteroidales bacterium]|nr:PUR family DNA/RNA-binding protein [Bacteroidales bacterium]
MNENIESKESREGRDDNEIMSTYIRCGKRTYFFDLKTSRRDEVYLTLTESKRRFNDNNGLFYEKHKVFILEQDLKKIHLELGKMIEFIETNPDLKNTIQTVHSENEEETKED